MKTRSTDKDYDPFSELPPVKAVDLGEVDRILRNVGNAPVVQQQKVEIIASEKNKVDLVPLTSPDLPGEGWIRQDLSSLCIPYKFNEVFMRPVNIDALSKLHSARVNQSFSILVDALNECINVDMRDVTPEDFITAMHWIRDNSYPTVPLKIEHKTMYGNIIEVNVRFGDLKITELNMTKEEYKVWYDKGYCFPTVRDAELINRNEDSMDTEQEWLLETIQYIRAFDDDEEPDYSKYIDKKRARLDKMLPGAMLEVEEFKALLTHGIEQTIKIIDRKFEPESAIKYMEDEVAKLKLSLKEIPEDMVDDEDVARAVFMASREIQKLEAEIEAIRTTLLAGEVYTPKEEVVAVKLTATEFFPRLRS